MHDHGRRGQRPTDRRIDTSDEPDHNRDQAWFECACCGTRYRSRRTAMQCCAECFDDPDPDPRSPPVAMTDGGHCADGTDRSEGVNMYYGAASGQQRAALRRLDPDGVMISHATQNNRPWEGDHRTFIDSGGYHHMMNGAGEYGESDEEYLEYLLKHRPHLYALRDYPCEPDLLKTLGRSIEDQQERTVDHHTQLYDKVDGHSLADSAVTVVQGWTCHQYLECLDALRDHGLPTDHVAIGSVCRRGYDEDIAEVVLAIREALPQGAHLHAFGVKGSVLRFREVVNALDSVDSAAYDYSVTRFSEAAPGEGYNRWRDSARAYLNWRHNLLTQMGTESYHDERTTQSSLVAATDGGNAHCAEPGADRSEGGGLDD